MKTIRKEKVIDNPFKGNMLEVERNVKAIKDKYGESAEIGCYHPEGEYTVYYDKEVTEQDILLQQAYFEVDAMVDLLEDIRGDVEVRNVWKIHFDQSDIDRVKSVRDQIQNIQD